MNRSVLLFLISNFFISENRSIQTRSEKYFYLLRVKIRKTCIKFSVYNEWNNHKMQKHFLKIYSNLSLLS